NLNPVLLAGTTVKRASLDNATEIVRLDRDEGDTVHVEKGGESIVKEVGVNVGERSAGALEFGYAEHCPEWNSRYDEQGGEAVHYCPNEDGCKPQIVGKLQHFVGRKMMDIMGFGNETIDTFFELGLVTKISDIYQLKDRRQELVGIARFGEKSIDNLLRGVEQSKEKPFEKVLFALGIRHVGETVAKKLAQHFRTLDNMKQASL